MRGGVSSGSEEGARRPSPGVGVVTLLKSLPSGLQRLQVTGELPMT